MDLERVPNNGKIILFREIKILQRVEECLQKVLNYSSLKDYLAGQAVKFFFKGRGKVTEIGISQLGTDLLY